ncbi:Major facilitator superfamily domain [Phytophthora cactorum]|nr:Major facilitator superfamily domain [Phytophthora cactorum]
MPRMAIRMAWSAQWAALGPYLGTMMPKYAVQLTQIIGPVTGILVAPIVGAFSDRSTSKWGRRRPFLMYGAVTSPFAGLLWGTPVRLVTAGRHWWKQERRRDPSILDHLLHDLLLHMDGHHSECRADAAISNDLRLCWRAPDTRLFTRPGLVLDRLDLGLRLHLPVRCGSPDAAMVPFHASVVMVGTVSIACFFSQERSRDKLEQLSESSWQQVKSAFESIYDGFKSLPGELLKYCVVIFCVMYGYSATTATKAQDAYNHGVQVAGGRTDLLFSIVGYIYSWFLPWLVKKFGAKWMLVVSLIPQSMLIVMAFSASVPLDVVIVIFTSLTITTLFALNVPVIVHVLGHDADIGVYVGVFNAANCLGQLLNFIIGAGVVDTSMGYKLPVFLGGLMSFFGLLFTLFLFKVKMHSM